VSLSNTYAKYPRESGPVSGTDVAHWRADNRVFEQIECVSGPDMMAMSGAGYAERVGVQHVRVRLFSLLGVETFLGTIPTDALSEKKGSDGVAISYEFWQHHFGSDPNVLGRRVFVDTDSAVFGVTTVEKTVSNSARPWTVLSEMLGIFAAMGLILAAIGIYEVISYSVSERSHELGLRMALGAQRGHVVRLVLGQALVLSVVGVVIGVAGSFAAAPLLAEFLYGVKPHDVLTLLLVSALLIAVTFLASYIPARHATLIDPMETLRHD
jgi:hypothetical protein